LSDKTPRIFVQHRAFGLWTKGIDDVLMDSFDKVQRILGEYGLAVERVRENRIDYCYHTNAIVSPHKVFKEVGGVVRNLYTNLKRGKSDFELRRVDNGTVLHKDYLFLGSVKRDNVGVRIYDKVKEVIEMGYKGFFFDIWLENGLVNNYDKYCFEYALTQGRVEAIHRARLMFYVEHGINPDIKQQFDDALSDKNITNTELKNLADSYMPATTPVINVEFETKRNFYRYSDEFIEQFTYEPRIVHPALVWLYKILDNRVVWLDYLTSKTLTFRKTAPRNEKNEDKAEINSYVDWWNRLRNTKIGGIQTDAELLRDYSRKLDKRIITERMINSVAALAVYDDSTKTGFIEDLSDQLAELSNQTDNDVYRLRKLMFVSEDGEIIEKLDSKMLRNYQAKKERKDKQLKNRKKQNIAKSDDVNDKEQNK
jgi:hypothetical protein